MNKPMEPRLTFKEQMTPDAFAEILLERGLRAEALAHKAAGALENCRLFAARHRYEEWAKTILRLCDEGGATGSPLRAGQSFWGNPELSTDVDKWKS